jgi:hypothetical protein
MSETMQRHTDQVPAGLMFSGAAIAIVGASVKKHAESVGELVVALGSMANTSHAAAVALGEWGLGLLVLGAVVALAGIVVIAASPGRHEAATPRR